MHEGRLKFCLYTCYGILHAANKDSLCTLNISSLYTRTYYASIFSPKNKWKMFIYTLFRYILLCSFIFGVPFVKLLPVFLQKCMHRKYEGAYCLTPVRVACQACRPLYIYIYIYHLISLDLHFTEKAEFAGTSDACTTVMTTIKCLVRVDNCSPNTWYVYVSLSPTDILLEITFSA